MVPNEALRFIFNIKGFLSFTQLHHGTNILSLEERRKEIRKQLFLKSKAYRVGLNFIVPLKPKAKTKKDFYTNQTGCIL